MKKFIVALLLSPLLSIAQVPPADTLLVLQPKLDEVSGSLSNCISNRKTDVSLCGGNEREFLDLVSALEMTGLISEVFTTFCTQWSLRSEFRDKDAVASHTLEMQVGRARIIKLYGHLKWAAGLTLKNEAAPADNRRTVTRSLEAVQLVVAELQSARVLRQVPLASFER